MPIDNLYFIDPIIDVNIPLKRKFYIAGARYYIGCEGKDCDKSLEISKQDKVFLELEPDNPKDPKAIKVLNKERDLLGYIPRYYSSRVFEMIQNERYIECTVLNVDKNQSCDECIEILLEVK